MSSVRPVLRVVRAGMFAALCVLFAAVGHMLMSGADVPVWTLAVGSAGTAAFAWLLAARERGPAAVTGATVGAQAILHSLFSCGQLTAALAGGAPARMTGGAAMTPMPGMPGMGVMDGMPGTGRGHEALGMLAAHLLGALLCGLWLAHGERAVFRLVRALAALRCRRPVPAMALRALLGRITCPAPPRVWLAPRAEAPLPRRLLLVRALTFRGPPLGTAAA